MKYKTGHRLFLVFALIANVSLAMFAHCADVFGYNERNEVVLSRRDEMHRRSSASEGRFGVAEPEGCASICEGAENEFGI